MLNKGQVEEVLQVEKDIVQFEQAFEGLMYLDSIYFDLIFKEYRQALLRDNERPLDNFNQEHRDLYMRLKFKALRDCGLPRVAVAAEDESKAKEPLRIEPIPLLPVRGVEEESKSKHMEIRFDRLEKSL